MPLAFEPGEAFQFDWSEDWAVLGGERTKLQVAHTKLSYSRAFIVRAYPLQTHELVEASGGNIRAVIADGAYDGEPTYAAIRAARPVRSPPRIIIPPREPSIPNKGQPHGGSERERHAADIARQGRIAWQRRLGYGKRSLVETVISRIKKINDGRLTSRTFGSQHNEIAIHIKIANRNMLVARPLTKRVR